MAKSNNNRIFDDDEQKDIENIQTRVEIGGKVESTEEINDKKALKFIQGIVKEYEDYVTVLNRRKSDFSFHWSYRVR